MAVDLSSFNSPDHSAPALVARAFDLKHLDQGWGDLGVVYEVLRRFADPQPATALRVQWMQLPRKHKDSTRAHGYFSSPVHDLPIPSAARTSYFELTLPQGASPRIKPPVCVLLGHMDEHSWSGRRRMASQLAHHGVGSLILETPFHGRRRAQATQTVSQQLVLHWQLLRETQALVHWLRQDRFEHVGVSGIGLGALVAAQSVAMANVPVSCVAHFTGRRRTQNSGRLSRVLSDTEPVHLGRPNDPDLAIILAPRQDTAARALAKQWGAQCRVRSVNGAFAPRREAILDVLGTSLAKYS